MFAERRSGGPRENCDLKAFVQISYAERIECVVENISENGAKLRFRRGGMKLPTNFRLLLPLFGKHCDERFVELRWAVGTAVGVRFVA